MGTKLDGPVQTLRAGGDTIAIATATEARCFDAAHGTPLWSSCARKGRRRLLDATRDVLVVADDERVIASSRRTRAASSGRSARRAARSPRG